MSSWSDGSRPGVHAPRALGVTSVWAPQELDATPAAWAAFALPDEGLANPSAAPAPEPGVPADEHEHAVREAWARGYEEGRIAGELAEMARLRTAVHAAEHALDELRAAEETWTGRIEENVCALAAAIARQVIGRELHGDPGVISDLVRRALTEFPIDQSLTVRVHPLDLSAISAASLAGAESIGGGRELRWVADARLAPGGCMVEGRHRIIDGRIDTSLERVFRRLTYNSV